MITPRQIIDDIRRSQYGIGLPTDSASLPVIANMRAQLDRALQLLSKDLYAKDIHFVLELLQNAEDNSYAPGVLPELRFILTEDAILVQNNETGFTEENVRSLCDVANSSKTKQLGYIGEKGIGFKSVFRVTDEPYILSNGFSFSLPLHDPQTRLGYVIPVWRQDRPAGTDLSMTNIYLPLTTKGQLELPKIADIHPSLLLFLKKLRRIEIRDAEGACTKRILRKGDGDRIDIHSNSGIDRWRVVRQSLAVPTDIIEEKREGVSIVEVVLAFPIADDGTADASTERPVYSFLPIRPYGFRFAIQADFILASSREDILADRAWNHWLRDSIPSLFLEAVELFRADDNLRTSYLAFVPSATAVTDPFFEAIPSSIVEILKETECILTASGGWAKPSDVLLVSDPLRLLLSIEDVKEHLQKEFIAEAFQVDAKLLQLLGVRALGFNDLVTCLNDAVWVASKGDAWLVRMLAHLNKPWNDAAIGVLRNLDIVPLEDGSLSSPIKGEIFFPLDRRTSYGFEQGLRIVRTGLFKAGNAPTIEAARKFLKGSLRVRPAEPTEIINEHILPVFEGTDSNINWQSKDAAFLVGALEYVKDHLEPFQKGGGSSERLANGLWIKYVHPDGNRYTKATGLYLTGAYGNQNDLESLFSGIADVRFVDSTYLDHSVARQKKTGKQGTPSAKQRDEHAASWSTFFVRLGVETVVRVSGPAGASEPDQVASPDLAKVIATEDPDRIAQALQILDNNWSLYRRNLEIERFYVQRNRSQSLGKAPTAFCKLLRGSEWIPTKDHGLCQPAKVCLGVDANKRLLGNHVPYLAVDLTNENFIADLGIQSEPTVDTVLSCLRGLAAERVEDVTLFRNLYRFLDEHFEEGSVSISAAFREGPLIYIPGEPRQFQNTTEVFWKDVSWLFGDARGYLSKPWKDFKEFFVGKLDIALTPSPEDYVELLKELSQKTPLPTEDEPKVWEVYRELERLLSASDDDPTETSWWQDFIDSGLYWIDKGEFWKNEDDVYINDQDEYYDLFKGQDGFAFLKLPENRFPSFRHLIEAGGLQFLSEAVHVAEVLPHYPRQETTITNIVREAAPFIVRYLYFKENEAYRTLEAANILGQMDHISVSVCDTLDEVLVFRDAEERVARDVAGTFPRLFVRADVDDPLDRIGVILSRQFQNPRGLDSFICLLLTKKNRMAMDRLMEAQRVPAMPTEELPPLSAPATEADETSHEDSPVEQEVADTDHGDLQSDDDADHGSRSGHQTEPSGHDRPKNQVNGVSSGGSAGPPTALESGEVDSVDDNEDEGGQFAEGGERDMPDRQGVSLPEASRDRGGKRGDKPFHKGETQKDGNRPSDDWRKSEDHKPRECPAKNWFRVLARPVESTELGTQGDPPPTDDVARQKVVEYEERRGRPATTAATNQAGYDVSSKDRHRGVRRLIEVKGLQQRWTGDATVTLTGAQFDMSRGEPPPGCEYWLYVIDGLGTDSPRIHPIRQFAAKVERVYLQAQDWLSEVDQADRDRLADASVEALGLPIIEFGEIVEKSPATAFLIRYPKNDLSDIVPVGGYLKCLPVESTSPLPSKGRLVMLLPQQIDATSTSCHPTVGELRWSVRQSLEGESQYVEVSLRPKTADPSAKPLTIRVSVVAWSNFRPYAVCEPLMET
jgi:hypothetical protein